MDNLLPQETAAGEPGNCASRTPVLGLALETAGSAGRKRLEAQIAERFAAQYNARIHHFLPYLLTLQIGGRSSAIAGLRPAAHGELFLERYLDSTVEQVISRTFKLPVDREQVVEIGNLASSEAGAGYVLFAVLAPLLSDAGYRWVICTATPQVETMLRRMNFTPTRVCSADPTRLGRDAGDWGRYYAVHPHVIAGDVRHAADLVRRDTNVAAILKQFGDIAMQLDQYRRRG